MPYREGVVLKAEAGTGSYVDVGLDRMVYLEHSLQQVRAGCVWWALAAR